MIKYCYRVFTLLRGGFYHFWSKDHVSLVTCVLKPWFLSCPTLVLHRPDLIDFDKLKKSNAHYNLQNAFNLAEQHLGLTKLLDPEGKGSRDGRWDF